MTEVEPLTVLLTEGPSDGNALGKMVNALSIVKEHQEDGADVKLVFDGAGVQWVDALSDEEHDYHDLYQSVVGEAVACEYCANAFEQVGAVEDAGVQFESDFEGHPSVLERRRQGSEILNF